MIVDVPDNEVKMVSDRYNVYNIHNIYIYDIYTIYTIYHHVPNNEVKMDSDQYNISAAASILPYRRYRRDLLHCRLSKMVTLSHQRHILRKAFKIL